MLNRKTAETRTIESVSNFVLLGKNLAWNGHALSEVSTGHCTIRYALQLLVNYTEKVINRQKTSPTAKPFTQRLITYLICRKDSHQKNRPSDGPIPQVHSVSQCHVPRMTRRLPGADLVSPWMDKLNPISLGPWTRDCYRFLADLVHGDGLLCS